MLGASRGKGQGGTTTILPQGNLFYQPDIRLKNTPNINNKCRKNEIKHC
jgi:hypothetical protein